MRAFIIFSFCVTLFTSLSAESVSLYSDCAAEIENDCKSVKKTRARIMQCLLEKGKNISAKSLWKNESKLSEKCAEAMNEI